MSRLLEATAVTTLRAARLAVSATVSLALLALAGGADAAPTMTRQEIVDIAKSGVGSRYIWGGGCWNPADRSWKGADCSGFVGKAWQVPTRSSTTTCSHPYSTYHFYNNSTHWTHISRSDMQRADALVYRSGGAGHIVLYVSGDKWGSAEVYEARGSAYGIVHRIKSVSSSYRARKRHSLVNPPPPPPPKKLGATAAGSGATALPASGGARYSLCPGQKFSFYITAKNSGDYAWSDVNKAEPGKAVRLGFRSGTRFGASTRISVNTTTTKVVAIGQTVRFDIQGTAPTTTGVKKTTWQMVSELVAWFGSERTLSFNVTNKPPGHGTACDTGKRGVCKAGHKVCSTAGLTCKADKTASAEVCDGLDNDCDGKVDEGGVCDSGPDAPAQPTAPQPPAPGAPEPPTSGTPPADPPSTLPDNGANNRPNGTDQITGGCSIGAAGGGGESLGLGLALLALVALRSRRRWPLKARD